MKILITGGNSGPALRILKAFENYQIVLADYGEMPAFSTSNYTFTSLGEKNKDITAHNLLNACLDQEADSLLPLYQSEITAVAKSARLFEEYNIHVLLPDIGILPKYDQKEGSDTHHWIVYVKGEVLYTSQPWSPVQADELSGIFNIREKTDIVTTTLFTINDSI